MQHTLADLETALDMATRDAQFWDRALDIVVDLFGASGALLPPSNPNVRGLWMAGTKPMKLALVQYLSEQWNLKDPREAVLTLMMERGYATDDDIFPDRKAKAEMPFYRDFLRKHNFGNVCTIRILTPNGYWPLTVHFANDHPPLSAKDVDLIGKIQPMFERAAKQAAEVSHLRIYEFTQFFSETDSEVFIFDADGNECFNVGQSGRIRSANKLHTLLPKEVSQDLRAEMKAVMVSDPKASVSRAFQFNEHQKSISVLVIQIPPKLRHFFMPFKTCAIRTQCGVSSAVKQSTLRDDYNLTDTEIATLELLASGKTPQMIAEIMSLKVATIRQRLKAIFHKTNVNSQVELIGLHARL